MKIPKVAFHPQRVYVLITSFWAGHSVEKLPLCCCTEDGRNTLKNTISLSKSNIQNNISNYTRLKHLGSHGQVKVFLWGRINVLCQEDAKHAMFVLQTMLTWCIYHVGPCPPPPYPSLHYRPCWCGTFTMLAHVQCHIQRGRDVELVIYMHWCRCEI